MTFDSTKSTRRSFLQSSAGAATTAIVTPYIFSSAQPVRAQAPSDRLRMGCIGVGSMGKGDAGGFNRLVDIVAVCDVDASHLDEAQNKFGFGKKDADGKTIPPDAYKDYRKVLERQDIDVVSVVTVDHWHVKIAIEALQAGKHVFCQKPLTLTVEENKLIRAACKKYNKTFTVGTQQRTEVERFMTAVLMIQKGFLGDIKHIVADIGGSPTCGAIPKAEVPAELDWELWQGQTPSVEYIATSQMGGERGKAAWPVNSRTHYEYRWWYEYSGGKFTDWGAHHIDIALWAIDQQKDGDGPVSFNPIIAEHPVEFKDGYPVQTDRYNSSHKFDIECKFANGIVMNVVSHSPDGNGVLFEGTKGKIHVSRGRLKGKPFEDIGGKLNDRGGSVAYRDMPELQKALPWEDYVKLFKGKQPEGHKQNFIRCIKEGGLTISDVTSHLQTMNSCHLCCIAARLNREIKWDPKTETIVGDANASTFLSRERRKGYEIPS
ncbi:MAG: Gfo/Idh/MocA family oxidoreductase [Planctomycetaceae bacterium]|jgi:predicted dehydrogenase|nr:Gfo/Idh/MocA family oxidoreductase [Planctomycetaceae bacterium]